MFTLRNNKGFSLIEMLGVIIILGILFSVVLVHRMDFDSNAKKVVVNYEETSTNRKAVHDKLMENLY